MTTCGAEFRHFPDVTGPLFDNRRMITHGKRALRRAGIAACAVLGLAAPLAGVASADDVAPGWSPNYTVFPYNLWQNRVTPEMVTAEGEACHWFNTQYDGLSGQIFGLQDALHESYDVWSGVQGAADALRANIDGATAFLDPRVHVLYITNYPDQSQYSPLFHGDTFYRIWYQLTQISDKIARQMPSGVINANTATLRVYGDAIRSSGVCNGA